MPHLRRKALCLCTGTLAVLIPLCSSPSEARRDAGSLGFPAVVPRVKVEVPNPLKPVAFHTPDGLRGWKVQLPGATALPTPAVAQGRVLVGGGFNSNDLYALCADTGRFAWKAHTNDNGPTSALTDEDNVIYNTESCTLESVNLRTGKRRWTRWIGSTVTSQPAAAGGRVYTCAPSPIGGFLLFCVSERTGKVLWKRPVPTETLSAPVIEGESVYLSTADGILRRFDGRTGKSEWKLICNATCAPWIAGGELHTTLRETFVGGVAVPAGKAPAAVLPRIWRAPGQDADSLPAEHYESLARVDLSGRLLRRGISRRSARYLSAQENAQRPLGGNEAVAGLMQAPADSVLGPAQINAGVTGMESLWGFQGSRPVVLNGQSFSARGEVLECLDARTDRSLWELRVAPDRATMRPLTPAAVVGRWVFFGTSRGEVACAARADGRVRWVYNLGSPLQTPPVVEDGRVFFGGTDGSVVCLDTRLSDAHGWGMWGGNAGHNGPTP